MRRDGVEQRIDRIGIGGLKSGVGLKPEPGSVLGVDVVVDASRLHLLAVITRMRNALPIRATVSIRRSAGVAARAAPIAVEWTAQNRERSPRGIAVKRKKLLVERHELGRWLISRSGYRVHAAARQLLQHIVLQCRRGHCRGADDRERNPNPFGVEEEKELFADDRASQTHASMLIT